MMSNRDRPDLSYGEDYERDSGLARSLDRRIVSLQDEVRKAERDRDHFRALWCKTLEELEDLRQDRA